MKKRKLTRLIAIFDTKEMEALGKFMRSPYFNENERLTNLFQFFASHYPGFDSPDFNEQNAWKSLSLDGQFSKGLFNQYITKLYKLVDHFVYANEVLKDKMYKGSKNAQYYLGKKAGYHLKKNNEDFLEAFNKLPQKSVDDYHTFYNVQLDDFNFNSFHHRRLDYKSLVQLHESLDQYVVIEKLRLMSLSESFFLIKKHKVDPSSICRLELTESDLSTLPKLAVLWVHVYNSIKEPSSELLYNKLKAYWFEHHSHFTSNTNIAILSFIQTIIRRAFVNKRALYMSELFDFYLFQIKNNWLVLENTIEPNSFNAIVYVALYLRKSDWALSFMKKHKKYLFPEIRSSVYLYNLSRLDFAAGLYEKCLRKISQVTFYSTNMLVGAKRIKLKVYYELNEDELMESEVNTLRVYLHRIKDVSDFYKNHHHLFTNVLHRLFKIKVGDKSVAALVKIKEEIDAQRSIPEYDWFIEKIAELEHGK